MIKGAIFDIDGTLIDSMGMWEHAAERYLAEMNIKAEPHLQKNCIHLRLQNLRNTLKRITACQKRFLIS